MFANARSMSSGRFFFSTWFSHLIKTCFSFHPFSCILLNTDERGDGMDESVETKVWHVDTGPSEIGTVVRDTGEGLIVKFPGAEAEEYEYRDIRSAE